MGESEQGLGRSGGRLEGGCGGVCLIVRVCLQSPGNAEQRQEGSGMRNAEHWGLNEDLFGRRLSEGEHEAARAERERGIITIIKKKVKKNN